MGSTKIINDWDFNDYKVLNYKYIKNNYINKELKFTDFKKEFCMIKMNQNKDLTFPILSMLTIDQIKKHSLNLLPKYFFKIPYSYECKAVSCSSYKISFFNEIRILDNKNIQFKDIIINPNSYVLPCMIIISHEIYSHSKAYSSDLSNESLILNPFEGFKKLIFPNYYDYESGYCLEYFLADDFIELQFLKSRNINLYPLTDFKYWTGINFNEMKRFTKKYFLASLPNFSNYEDSDKEFEDEVDYENIYDKRSIDEDKVSRCVFKTFNPKRRKKI